MRNLLLALALFVSSLGFSQETTVNEITPSGVVTETVVIEEPKTFYINEELKPYVETFVAALLADGWNLGFVKEQDVFIMFDFELGQDGINRMKDKAGLALGMNEDTTFVIINVEAWLGLEEWGRQDLINHELMHDWFNVVHTDEDDPSKLMHPQSYPKSWAETVYRLIDALKDLNKAYGF